MEWGVMVCNEWANTYHLRGELLYEEEVFHEVVHRLIGTTDHHAGTGLIA